MVGIKTGNEKKKKKAKHKFIPDEKNVIEQSDKDF